MEDPATPELVDDAPRAPCRYCGEVVLTAAKKCRFCGEWLDEAMREVVRNHGQAPAVDAPVVLKVWGALLMALSGLLVGLQVVSAVYSLYFLSGFGGFRGSMLVGTAISTTIGIVIFLIFGRLGWGLWRGQRTAVIGFAVFGGLVFALIFASSMRFRAVSLVPLAIAALAYFPPLVVGISRWRRLT